MPSASPRSYSCRSSSVRRAEPVRRGIARSGMEHEAVTRTPGSQPRPGAAMLTALLEKTRLRWPHVVRCLATLALTLTAPFGAVAQISVATHTSLDSTVVRDLGSGNSTYVLISGLVGGIAGFRRTQALLATQGHRVIAIDPYRLSLDSADVSFDALARRVDRVLRELGAASAHVVGHSHGGAVALRLAANSPERVSDLCLVDVGAKASARGPLLNGAIRLVPLITRLPGGRTLVRRRFINGLRDNSGSSAWLDDSTQHAYADPMFQEIGRVVAMALRVGNMDEPEPLDAVLSRVHVPVTVLLGQLPHASGPDVAEMRALEQLGALVHVQSIAGVAHFPHEEAPDEFVRIITAPRIVATVARSGDGR